MHIVHVNFAKGFRGGERQTQLLIQSISNTKMIQTLLVRKGSELGERCKDINSLSVIEISKPYALHVSAINGADVIHAHETKALQFAYIASLLKGIPYIVTRRVDNAIKSNFLNKIMYKKAEKSVALSKAIEKQILRVSPDASCQIIPSAFSGFQVNKAKLAKIKERFNGKFLIGHIGALDEKHKGQSYLIHAVQSLQGKYRDIHLILLGRGDDEGYLKSLCSDSDAITFEGFVDNVGDYIHALNLFVFPSNNEGLGSILLDVMSGNVPIIASNVGGIPDIITNEKNGILVPTQDFQAISEAIERLYADEKLRKEFISASQEKIAEFSVEKMSQEYIKIYEGI
ncbi:MAG: glycosyltransferase family 4 protein [Campylobacterota bacterium]|nr:glycosyltransferase family 4 protein [Campylobacterota bacterium]